MAPTKLEPSKDGFLKKILFFQSSGEFFRQTDIAKQAVSQFPDEARFKYFHVFALANAGAPKYAKKLFHEYKLELINDLDTKCLEARLLKQSALSSRENIEDKSQSLIEAAELYEQAMLIPGSPNNYYPRDNAAQLYLLAGQKAKANKHAEHVLKQILELPNDPEDQKWRIASQVNSHLILKNETSAKELAGELKNAFASDSAGAATTIRHIEKLVMYQNLSSNWIDDVRSPGIAFFAGHIISPPGVSGRFQTHMETLVTAKIRTVLENLDIAHCYGALAAGADIIFAEELLRKGAKLTVVLPCSEEEFIKASVLPSGVNWETRYHAIRNRSDVDIIFATTEPLMDDDTMFCYGARLAMGLTILKASLLRTHAHQIALWDGKPSSGLAGTAIDIATWATQFNNKPLKSQTLIPLHGVQTLKAPEHIASVTAPPRKNDAQRITRAMLFGDFKGFSKLRDTHMTNFVGKVFGEVAKVLHAHTMSIHFKNSWGDGIYVVTEKASEAAELAVALQDALNEIDLPKLGLPDTLKLRIGGHLGPIFKRFDPIVDRDNFFGSQVSFSARIEPVAPPGTIYVSEQFAAALALENATQFQCALVGTTELSKQYGATRIFQLQRSSTNF